MLIIFSIIVFIIVIKLYRLKKTIDDSIDEEFMKKDIIEELFISMGSLYDETQDIIYNSINSWQRKYGYCKLYDKLCWILHMSIDSEPIYFKYNNKVWLIEFWKGQYAIATGCEIGIYFSEELEVPMKNVFFYSVDDKDMIGMEFTLRRDDKVLFQRKENHWWLTGFRFGEYSNPSSLSMDISLTFKDKEMLTAFLTALNKIGYNDITVKDDSVSFIYNKPKTKQCFYRKSIINFFIQRKNKRICKKYNKMVKGINNIEDKIKIIKKKNLQMYIIILKVILNKKLLYRISKN